MFISEKGIIETIILEAFNIKIAMLVTVNYTNISVDIKNEGKSYLKNNKQSKNLIYWY